VISPAELSHPAIPRMGLAPARLGGMTEKGWVGHEVGGVTMIVSELLELLKWKWMGG